MEALEERTCPKCGGAMAAGYIIDRGTEGVRSVEQWIEGAPEKSFWTGLKTKNRLNLSVITWRCGNCGYLESYALGEPEA